MWPPVVLRYRARALRASESAAREQSYEEMLVSDDPSGSGVPFPREQAADIVRRLPSYLRLGWHVARDPALPKSRRGAILAAVVYGASPVDAVPGIIPVLGQLDDMILLVAAVTWALASMPQERRHQHLVEAGLSEADIEADLRALRGMGGWVVGRAWSGARSLASGARSSLTPDRFGRVSRGVRRRLGEARRPSTGADDRGS